MASVEGMTGLQARFRALPVEVRRAVRAEMERIAAEIVAQMRRLAPRDTGRLAQSIGWTWGSPPDGSIAVTSIDGAVGDKLTIYAGGEATREVYVPPKVEGRIYQPGAGGTTDYAVWQEFGTVKMQANPFFWPSIRAARRSINRRLNAAAVKAARKAWGA